MHWMIHLEGGPRRVNHAAVAIGEQIYTFGGYCSGEVQCRNEPIDIHVLNTATYRWQRIPSNSEVIARSRLNSLKPSTSQYTGAEEEEEEPQAQDPTASALPTRRRARSVAELHPLGQLRYIRPVVDDEPETTRSNDGSESNSSGRFSGLADDTDAIDSDELASMEVDSDSNLSDIDEEEPSNEEEDDSDYEDFPGAARRGANFQQQPMMFDPFAWAPANGQDHREADVPYQRYGHTVVAYEGKAYLWGGRNDEFGSSQLLHEYNPATNEWRVVKVEGMQPPSRDGHTAVMHGHIMYVFGGFEENNHRFSQETYAFDFRTSTWSQVNTNGEPPQHRDFHTACVLNGRMYVFGGRSDEMGQFHSSQDKYCAQLMALDLKSNKWMEIKVGGEVPSGRRSHSVWTHNNKMYMFGGYESNKDEHYNDLYEFDPSNNNQWRRVRPTGRLVPQARRRQCTLMVGGRMFLFGGTMPRVKNDGKSLVDLADLYVLDFQPSLESLCSEAIIRHGLQQRFDEFLPSCLKRQLQNMSTANTISKSNTSRIDCTNG